MTAWVQWVGLRHYTKLPWKEIKTKDTLEQKMGCRPS